VRVIVREKKRRQNPQKNKNINNHSRGKGGKESMKNICRGGKEEKREREGVSGGRKPESDNIL